MDVATPAQARQMTGNPTLGQPQKLYQLGHVFFALQQMLKDFDPGGSPNPRKNLAVSSGAVTTVGDMTLTIGQQYPYIRIFRYLYYDPSTALSIHGRFSYKAEDPEPPLRRHTPTVSMEPWRRLGTRATP